MAYGQIVEALDRIRWIQDNGDYNAEVDSILQDAVVDLEAALEDLDRYAENLDPAVEGAEADDAPVLTTYTEPSDG